MNKSFSTDQTVVELQKGDAAFILRANGDKEMFFPGADTDADEVAQSVMLIAAVGYHSDNPDWCNKMIDEFKHATETQLDG